jgi:hypothetical protein
MRPTRRKIPSRHQIHAGSRRRDGRRYSGARLRILPPSRLRPQGTLLTSPTREASQMPLTADRTNTPWRGEPTKAPPLRRIRDPDESEDGKHPANQHRRGDGLDSGHGSPQQPLPQDQRARRRERRQGGAMRSGTAGGVMRERWDSE